MHSWIFRHRSRLLVLYGYTELELAAPALPAAPHPAPGGSGLTRDKRGRVILQPSPRRDAGDR